MAQSIIHCSLCGKLEDLEIYKRMGSPTVSLMRKETLCYECVYWKRWLVKPEPDCIVVSGSVYKVVDSLRALNIRQAAAKGLSFLMDLNCQNVYACRLLKRGDVPEHFKKELSDQYKLITREEYKRFRRYDAEMCLSKGCFDRYHCLWYRADIAEPDEPWNTIPRDYIIGSEDCPSFINKAGKRNV